MARPLSHGTPSRTKRYLIPGRGGLVTWSLIGAGAALALGVVLHLIGVRRVASPGTVASAHANIDTRCAQCHQPQQHAVSDLRCERCHDPVDLRRYETPAHALVSGGDPWHASKAGTMPCAACHVDHRGFGVSLARTDDERCATCHEFASFRRHPEFAARRAQRGPDEGMDFSHEKHLIEIAKIDGERCTGSCHVLSQDQRGYDPINFDAHCAKCHVKGGVLTLNGTDPLASGPVFGDVLIRSVPNGTTPALSAPDGRGRVTFARVTHRDPWILANAARLTRTLAPAAWAAERERLVAERDRLSAIVDAVPLSAQSETDLTAWYTLLRGSTPAVARASTRGGDPVIGLAAVAGTVDPTAAQLVAQLAPQPAAPRPGASDAASLEARRAELQQLLDAVSARSGPALAGRVADLKKRLAALKPDASAAAADPAAIRERLNDVDSALKIAAPLLRSDAFAALQAARDAVAQQATGAIDEATYEARRTELVNLVDGLATRGDSASRARVAELRAAVLTLPQRTGAPAAMDRGLDRARLLERIATELELRTDAGPNASITTNRERSAAERLARQVNAQIAALDAAPPPLAGADPVRAKGALRGLLGPCLACHSLNDDETALRKTALNGPVMPASTFSHKPHVAAQCETCHSSISTSKAGADLNVPGLAVCQTCHKSSQARTDCAECHAYHPRSSADLVVSRWP